MLVLVTYDVSTETKEGRYRLNRVAKKCVAYGQRVQNSVFECNLDWDQYLKLQNDLKKIIKQDEDSLRFYNLGNSYKEKVVHIGVKPSILLDNDLII
ncbi:MAG TPA: CRISPR-associated endonuclease Cas2 [Clostridia bacterium]|jgi:CRISPR-associated protein Cas2